MARIVLGIGTSHGPMLSIPSDYWKDRVAVDRAEKQHPFRGGAYTFDELVALRSSENLSDQIRPEVLGERHARCQQAIANLADTYAATEADMAVIVGNDQMEVFTREAIPAFSVFRGPYVEGIPRTPEFLAKLNPAIARAELDRTPAVYTQYPCLPEVGWHVTSALTEGGFDVTQMTRLQTGEIGSNAAPHAYGFVYRRIMRDKVTPHVPVFVNTFYPPNQPPAARCFEFGRALARAVTSWPEDKTVVMLASGGMTHFVVDETVDREVLRSMERGDAVALGKLSETMLQAGTSEIKNWITVAGAMTEARLKMNLVDYVPCYRSEAGTGSGLGFAIWQ
jgi:OH-DDVA oxygenase